MRVALVGAEFEENLAVRYLWAALEAAGREVIPIVFNEAGQTEAAARQLAESGAELAGFSMVFTYRARQFARLASRARELGYAGFCVAGGHFAAFNAERLLQDVPAFDAVACGEGEHICCALANALEQDRPLSAVAGLVWRDGTAIANNHSAAKPLDLDELPRPPRKRPLDDYLGIGITNILSSRGCSYRCAFCSIAAWHRLCGGPRLRLRAVDAVADEMATLHRDGARIFNFHDDNFFPPTKAARWERVRALRSALAERGLQRIAFAIKSRPDTVEEDLFGLLKSLGLFRVFLGIEAGSTTSLAQLGRSQTLRDNERALAVVNQLDIHTCFNLLLFNPDSTLQDVAANVAFLRRNRDNPMNFCRTEIYAGTPLERRLRAGGRLRGDYWGYDYIMADPRAQALFEVVYPCFEERNYGDRGLHHLTMQVDYEHQLLSHFFGPREALRRRVKAYVRAVNGNTAGHLERLVDAIARLDDPATHVADLVARHRPRLRADDAELTSRGQRLLEELRSEARPVPAPLAAAWVRTATAAGLAATLTVSAAACKGQDPSHPTEMAPVPTEPRPDPDGDSHPAEMAPEPPYEPGDAGAPLQPVPVEPLPPPPPPTHPAEMVAPPPPPPPSPPSGFSPAGLLPRPLVRRALQTLSDYVWPPQDVELELWFDRQGRPSRIALRGPNLDEEVVRHAGSALASLSTSDPDVVGRKFLLRFSAAELRAARPHPPTQPHEKAPLPPSPPTHPRERAPQPPSHIFEMAPAPPPPKKR